MIDNATKRERLQKWCAALRSGEFEQGYGSFHCGDAHCCLGVAEIVGCDLMEGSWAAVEMFYKLRPVETTELARLNDSRDYTFLQIADYIEQNLVPAGE